MADQKRNRFHQCGCQECKSRGSVEVLEYHQSINRVMSKFDERSRRLFAGLVAKQIGRGGIQRVAEITGLSRVTIRRGLRECEQSQPEELNRVRRAGGGRKLIEKKFPK
jgi:ribosomal protein L44E